MRWPVLLFAAALVAGCVERTIVPGISFGMTPEEVVQRLEKSQKIVTRDARQIVAEGYDSFWEMRRRNIFVFEGGRLVAHQNVPMP